MLKPRALACCLAVLAPAAASAQASKTVNTVQTPARTTTNGALRGAASV